MKNLYILVSFTRSSDSSAWLACGYGELVEIIDEVVLSQWGIKNPIKIPSEEEIDKQINENGIAGYSPDPDNDINADEYFLIFKQNEARVDTTRMYLNAKHS